MTKNENRINKLFEELVPTSGKADSLAGELVRATARIGYRFFNDGDMVNQGYGKETCNPAARFLIAKGNAEISSLTVALWEIFSEDAYEKVLDTLEGAVADYIKQNPDLRSQPTKDKSSWVATKQEESSQSLQMVVHSKDRYQLAHLLEKGHAKGGGGRVAARPHIAPAEQEGVELLQSLIEKALK